MKKEGKNFVENTVVFMGVSSNAIITRPLAQ
jgi:hypothetical protein